MDALVDVAWLSDHLEDPDLVVLDCSVEITGAIGAMNTVSGRGAFDAGHIPGAGFADLITDLSETDQTIGFAVPTPEQFGDAMGRLGVGDASRVVLYDSSASMWAARVWWMLRWIGFDRAAILDGGLGAWQAAGQPLSTESPVVQPDRLTPQTRPQLIAARHEVLAAVDDPTVRLIDTLPEAHFCGEMALYERPGHIPGAENIPVFAALDDTGRLATNDQVRATHGDDRDRRAVAYCGGGIAASLTAFAMVRAGYTDVAVYTASLQEWTADLTLPMATP